MNRLVEEANTLLQGQDFSYAICGGFALDLFLGYESRVHGDIDVLAFWEDREKIITFMQSKGFCVFEMLGGGKVHRITDIRTQEKLRKNIFCCTKDCELVRLYDTEEQDIFYLDFQHIGLSKLNYIEFLFNEISFWQTGRRKRMRTFLGGNMCIAIMVSCLVHTETLLIVR